MTTPQVAQPCVAGVNTSGYRTIPCGKKGKVQYKGQWFCGIHDPVKRQQQQALRDKGMTLEMAAQNAEREKQAAEVSGGRILASFADDLDIPKQLRAAAQQIRNAAWLATEARQALALHLNPQSAVAVQPSTEPTP